MISSKAEHARGTALRLDSSCPAIGLDRSASTTARKDSSRMTRRLPVLVILAAIAALGTPTLVAAAEPALSATVIPGQEIDLAGSGFPADADVQLVILRNGADAGSQVLHTDAAGAFTATIDAGPGRGGGYTMTATAGTT